MKGQNTLVIIWLIVKCMSTILDEDILISDAIEALISLDDQFELEIDKEVINGVNEDLLNVVHEEIEKINDAVGSLNSLRNLLDDQSNMIKIQKTGDNAVKKDFLKGLGEKKKKINEAITLFISLGGELYNLMQELKIYKASDNFERKDLLNKIDVKIDKANVAKNTLDYLRIDLYDLSEKTNLNKMFANTNWVKAIGEEIEKIKETTNHLESLIDLLYNLFTEINILDIPDVEENEDSSENEEQLIKLVEERIKLMIEDLTSLKSFKNEFDLELEKVKISSTTGNLASIIGTGLMFTPAFYLGLGLMGYSAVTSINDYISDSKLLEKKLELIKKEKQAEEKRDDLLRKILNTSTKSGIFYQKAVDLKKMYDVSRGYTAAYNGINGAANAMKAGARFGPFTQVIAGVSVLISVADLASTWMKDDSNSVELGNFIKEKEKEINAEIKVLEDLKSSFRKK